MKKIISVIICIAMILQMSVVFASAISSNIMKYAPIGTRDLAIDATVRASSAYEAPNGQWSIKNINDGKLQNETGGFSTDTAESVPDEYTPAWLLFDLEGYYDIKKVVLFSYGAFPDTYRIEVSADGVEYKTVASDSGQAGNNKNKEYSVSDSEYIRFVRLYVSKRGNFDGNPKRFVQLSEIAIFGTECNATDSGSDVNSYTPANCVNLALESKVSSNDSIENDYISVNYLKNNSFNDKKFFSSATSGENSGNVYIDFELDNYAEIQRVVLFRTGIFPKALEIQVSLDGENFRTVKSGSGYTFTGPNAMDFVLDKPEFAKYVRVLITERNHGMGVEETRYYVQFGEIGIYGVKNAYQSSVDKNSVTLKINESIGLTHNFKVKSFDERIHTTQWASQNPGIASVNSDGKITAISAGRTFVTTTDEISGITDKCEVIVKTKNDNITNGVITSILDGPFGNLMNDEQYQLVADAGIDLVYNRISTEKTNKEAIELAYRHGMSAVVCDTKMVQNCLEMSEDDFREWYENYRTMSGLVGIYVKDEPKNPNVYAQVYNRLKAVDPDMFVHVNFLPGFVYDSYEQYEYQLDDFAQLTDNTDYLMFDIYPFLYPTGVDYKRMFDSYNAVRKAGLKNDVKTAAYIQAVGYGPVANENFAKRIPTATDILYQDMISLAYGAKHLSYFKWDGGGKSTTEQFSDGGIDVEGNITPTYTNIKNANAIVHNLGKTLKNLDAKEVYLSGSNTYSQDTVPKDFFVTTTSSDSLVFSYMKDRETGRNYLMIVNNNIDSSVSPTLNFNSAIRKLSVINNATGAWSDISISGTYKPTIGAGSAVLIALPEGYDYGSTKETANANIAYHSSVGGKSSIGEDGWYLSCLTDGYITSNTSLGLKGWSSELKDAPYQTEVTINLGEVKAFNSLTLYASDEKASFFPKGYKISSSADGVSWTQIASESNVTNASTKTYNTDDVYAKYVKITVDDMNCVDGQYAAALAEVTMSSSPSVVRQKIIADGLKGYYVYAYCIGSSYVRMPSWTEKNKQDDIIWHDAESGEWKIDNLDYNFRCYIPVSAHKNEIGKYITHIYAYKNAQEYHAIATSYEFGACFTFDMNYGGISENLSSRLENSQSGGGIAATYNQLTQALTINGTLTSSFNLLQSVPLDRKIKSGDRIKVTVEKLGGTSNNIALTCDLQDSKGANPCGTRIFKDIKFGSSAVFEINSDAIANEIYGYRLWLYYNERGNQSVENLSFRVKIEVESGDYLYSPEKMNVLYGENFGSFYNPQNNGDGTFAGWFTSPVGGERVDTKTKNTEYVGNITLYAHWNVPEIEYFTGIRAGLTKSEFESEYLKAGDSTITYKNLSEKGIIGTGVEVEVRDKTTGLLNAKYIVILYGDVNGDGWYDGTDAVTVSCIEKEMLTKEHVGEAVYMAADCNHDGAVDSLDADILQQAGLLLKEIDQSKPTKELLATSSAYVEYINLIDQSPTNEKTSIWQRILNFFVKIINYIKLHFAIVK